MKHIQSSVITLERKASSDYRSKSLLTRIMGKANIYPDTTFAKTGQKVYQTHQMMISSAYKE
jgi:hypothetical protein